MMRTPSQFDFSEAPWERLESPVCSVAISSCEDTGGYHTFREDIEYWGPRTSMSICSLAGIAWVKGRVKSKQPDFQTTANNFTQNVARMLKLEKQPTKRRKEEPGFDDALRFTKAFFEETPEAALGIVRRSCFESRLRSFYKSSQGDDNFSWCAMRNIIFAYGCRVVLSKTASYSEAQQESWSYFENALSVHTEILCFRTSVMGAQALTLMVISLSQYSYKFARLTRERLTLRKLCHADWYNTYSLRLHIDLHVDRGCIRSHLHPGSCQKGRNRYGKACFGLSIVSTNKFPAVQVGLRLVLSNPKGVSQNAETNRLSRSSMMMKLIAIYLIPMERMAR